MTAYEAHAIYASGEKMVVDILMKQDAKIQELEAQREINSKNSSMPPSTDGFNKPVPKSRRKTTGRKRGGQKGHPGATLAFSEKADYVINHPVNTCSCCNRDLSEQSADKVIRRQVFDIPPIKIEVTEHLFEEKICPNCCTVTSSTDIAPADVSSPVQYGPRLAALCVYLKTYQLLPFKRSAEMIRTLFGGTLCEGTLANMIGRVSGTLDSSLSSIVDILTKANVAHFDETGASVDGVNNWVHVACTEKVTLYMMHERRGSVAMDAMGVLSKFTGTAIHDHWKAYYTYGNCTHGLCNAHHLRELTYIHEVVGQDWAKHMSELLIQIKSAVDTAKNEKKVALEADKIVLFIRCYDTIIDMGNAANPAPVKIPGKRGASKNTKAGNLVKRLYEHRREVLAFMYDFSVPFENNLAERDIRMMKVQQKISGTFRGDDRGTNFCRIRSYISTARKNCLSAFDALAMAITGTPFQPRPE